MEVKRRGSSGARCPVRSARSPRSLYRPFVRTCTTSIDMQLASANASACIGDGPATDALSRDIWMSPERPPKTRSCSQTSSIIVGGFATASAIPAFYAVFFGVGDGAVLRGLRAVRLIAADEAGDCQPHERQQNKEVRQVLAVDPVRPVGFGRIVQRLAVREDIGFGELVEPVAVTGPQPRDERGANGSAGGPGDYLRGFDGEDQLRHQERRLHPFTRDHQQGETEDPEEGCAADLER